jgi:hypothetical protein
MPGYLRNDRPAIQTTTGRPAIQAINAHGRPSIPTSFDRFLGHKKVLI